MAISLSFAHSASVSEISVLSIVVSHFRKRTKIKKCIKFRYLSRDKSKSLMQAQTKECHQKYLIQVLVCNFFKTNTFLRLRMFMSQNRKGVITEKHFFKQIMTERKCCFLFNISFHVCTTKIETRYCSNTKAKSLIHH